MIEFVVQFYYKNEPAFRGRFTVKSTTLAGANDIVRSLVETSDSRIPGNWDLWKILQ